MCNTEWYKRYVGVLLLVMTRLSGRLHVIQVLAMRFCLLLLISQRANAHIYLMYITYIHSNREQHEISCTHSHLNLIFQTQTDGRGVKTKGVLVIVRIDRSCVFVPS